MNQLDIAHINSNSPYEVAYDEYGNIRFTTDYDVEYLVDFDEDTNPHYTAYLFNLTNVHHKKSPGDKKIPLTIVSIIEEFFRQNPDILLYMCSTEGGLQAQRARLFLRWFNGARQKEKYVIRAMEVKGEEGRNEYVAMIVQRNNPNLDTIIRLYDAEIAMFNEFKP